MQTSPVCKVFISQEVDNTFDLIYTMIQENTQRKFYESGLYIFAEYLSMFELIIVKDCAS